MMMLRRGLLSICTSTSPLTSLEALRLSTYAQMKDEKSKSPSLVLQSISKRFPASNLMFGYGSGVLRQSGVNQGNMVDLIIAVDDSTAFHQSNLRLNPSDYFSLLRCSGPSLLSELQRGHGASLYFNTLVRTPSGFIKYGVIETSDLIHDLSQWTHLYAAGRLHKPVVVLRESTNRQLSSALISNLRSALHVSLLLLPSEFRERELYTCITGLSYTGDFRMKVVGEDKKKVNNIVENQVDTFRMLYKEVIDQELVGKGMLRTSWQDSEALFQHDIARSAKLWHLQELPMNLKISLLKAYKSRHPVSNDKNTDEGDIGGIDQTLSLLSESPELSVLLHRALADITSRSSRSQAFKGVITAGPVKTVQYSWGKFKKAVKSRFN